MKYVFLTDGVVTDQTNVDPFLVFSQYYASQFIQAPDDVTFGWIYQNGQFVPPTPPTPTPEEIQAQNKSQAESLLQATDWVNQPDAIDPARTPHLTNQADFLDYREILRGIAVTPPTTPVTDWPAIPKEIWA